MRIFFSSSLSKGLLFCKKKKKNPLADLNIDVICVNGISVLFINIFEKLEPEWVQFGELKD